MDLDVFNVIPPWDWPEDAGEVFLEIMRDRQADPAKRLMAVELASDYVVISDENCIALLTIMLDEDEPVEIRAAAASSLGTTIEEGDLMGFDDPEDSPIAEGLFIKTQKALRAIYMDTGKPGLLRRRALESSSRAPQEWHREAVSAAYKGDDADWRLTAVFCMGYQAGFEKQILEAMRNGDALLAREAVMAADQLELDAAWPVLVSLIDSKGTGKELLIAVMDAMADIRPLEAGAYLARLANSKDEEIAFVAREGLAAADAALCEDLEDEDWDEDWEDD